MKKSKWTKVALALSACLFVLWWALGTGATLAWFSDTDVVRNKFEIGLLKMDVDFRNSVITDYTPLQGTTEAFNDEALYEPGYTQVVYLRIDNQGNMPFDYKFAVTVNHVNIGYNQWGEEIYLPNYLRYGVVFGPSEAEVEAQVQDRLTAQSNAPYEWNTLGTWSEDSPYTFAAEDEYHYAALIVYMPEEVNNVANYRGDDQPRVELGITVSAQQVKTSQ